MNRLFLIVLISICAFTANAQWMQWECRSNSTLGNFATYLEDMKSRGYAPVNINMITIAGETKVSSIWQKANVHDWACWYDMDKDGLIRKINEFKDAGMSPVDISMYKELGEIRYAAIWKKSNYKWLLELEVSPDMVANKITEYAKNGYYPKDINTVLLGTKIYYACLFDGEERGIQQISYNASESEFQNQFDRLTPQGYYPIDINYFNELGTLKCNGIWMKGTKDWESRRGYTESEFQDFLDKKTDEGYIPIDLDQYYLDGINYYGATLVKPVSFTTAKSTPTYNNSYVRTYTNEDSKLLNINPVMQQTEVWCWLATGEMILKHYDIPNLNEVGNYQCGIIGSIFPGSNCSYDCFQCVRGSGSNAMTVKMFKDYAWIAGRKIFDCQEGKELDFKTIKQNIQADKPILCGISPNRRIYSYGAEHVVVLVGYKIINNVPYIIINDPYPYPRPENLYLNAGGTSLKNYQYLIPLQKFTNNIFWHWSLHNIIIG